MFNTDFNFYGTILIFSFIINAIVTAILSNRNKLKFEEIIHLLLYEFIGIILGGKYYTLFTQYSLYKNTNFLYISMSSLGAFIGAFVMVFIFSKQFKISCKKVFNIISPCIPLMYSLGKIGCFLAGCCIGFKYSGFGAVTYNYSQFVTNEFSYFPVQIIESIVFFGIFIFMMKLSKESKGQIFSKCLIASGSCKFLLEFLRIRENVSFLSINQIFCLLLIVIGFISLKIKNDN